MLHASPAAITLAPTMGLGVKRLFFIASKLFWMIAPPISLLIIAALLGTILARGRFGRTAQAVSVAASALLLIGATAPFGLALISPLENRFPSPPADMPEPYGIVVLGGAMKGDTSAARGQAIFDEGERMIQAVLLAERYPNTRIVFTAGAASIIPRSSTEADEARKLMVDLRVDPDRIVLEEKSRNTDENARFTAAIVHPKPDQRWLLVTSAFHMARSMGVFEKVGFNVIAYPVAFRTPGSGLEGLGCCASPGKNLQLLEIALREWIGLVAYRATGRIDHLFPGPDDGRG